MRFTIGFFIESIEFTPAVIAGEASLGGSESACLGLARALKGRGHDVHIITTQLTEGCEGPDASGVVWHHVDEFAALNQFIEWDVFVSLRTFGIFLQGHVRARLRLLWNQDLLTQPQPLMAAMHAVDGMVYVSEYQRRQYEDRLPELKHVDVFITKNGYDPARVPPTARITKDPNRIIHITRPERGLRPLLAMWPKVRERNAHAELHLCRYSSMYDPQGWGQVCASYDEAVAEVNRVAGGITYLGELGKGALYQAIADAAVMWYPGVSTFAETSCIAAIEAQACGTPFVGSVKGALPETVPGGILIPGNADTTTYQVNSVAAVLELMDACRDQTFAYRQRQKAGRDHVTGYTYAMIAAEWETHLEQTFRNRYEAHKLGVMRQLLHDDDHVAAKVVAMDLIVEGAGTRQHLDEACASAEFCAHVIAGKDQTATHYAQFACDPLKEAEFELRQKGRLWRAAGSFKDCTHVLDVACGSGAFALLLAKLFPTIRVTGIDYAQGNIDAARAAAEATGVGDRCTFICAPFWDFDAQEAADIVVGRTGAAGAFDELGTFDGAFVGEFLEHVANCDGLIDYVETFLTAGAPIVYTCPHGPFTDLLTRGAEIRRGHVHQFCHDDIDRLFGAKKECAYEYLTVGQTRRGAEIGHWVIRYSADGVTVAQPRDLAHRTVTCRPLQRLTVGLIVGPHELDLRRCLDAIWAIADEIVIGDTGMDAATRQVAEDYGARILELAPVLEQPEGFSGARNAVLEAASGEWFLWIDADERLIGAQGLRQFLDSGPFNGYGIRQQHLMLDVPSYADEPIRLFRRRPDVRFYGCVHEQPQMGDANGDITPALQLHTVTIAHTGYLSEATRRDKALGRNLPLLKRDQEVFPNRRLGRLLWLRDFVNLADYERERSEGVMTEKAIQYLRQTVALFEVEFADPTDKYHQLARPWYERALQDLGLGFEIELSLAGRRGGLKNQHAKPRRVWVRRHADLQRLLEHEIKQIRTRMEPEPLKVDPFVDAPALAPAEQEAVSAS